MIYINVQDKWEVCIFMQYDALLIDCLRKLNCSIDPYTFTCK